MVCYILVVTIGFAPVTYGASESDSPVSILIKETMVFMGEIEDNFTLEVKTVPGTATREHYMPSVYYFVASFSI